MTKLLLAGQHLLSQVSIRYQKFDELWKEIQTAGGVIETNHICFANIYQTTEQKQQLFTPIGSLLCALLEKFAWKDPSLRPLAEYFLLADILGSGQGRGKIWPLTLLSGELVEKLRRGGCLVSGERWNEWDMIQ